MSGKCALMVDMVGPCDDQNDDDQDSNPPRLGRAPLLPTPRIRQPSLAHLHRHSTDLRQLQQLPMPVFRLRRQWRVHRPESREPVNAVLRLRALGNRNGARVHNYGSGDGIGTGVVLAESPRMRG